jgi:hypothetical protein
MGLNLTDRRLWLVAGAGALVQIVLNVLSTGLSAVVQSDAGRLDPASTEAGLGLLATVLLCLCAAGVSAATGVAYVVVIGRERGLDVSTGLLGGAVTGGLAGVLAGVIGGCLSALMLPLVVGAMADVNADALLFGGMAVGGLIGAAVGIVTAVLIGLFAGALMGGLGGGIAAALIRRR